MAGPGGGPPRKSHTKSRKGCRMCKKRHIRCDEVFPQCRNCIKHNVRCDYMDMPVAGEELMKGSHPPDLQTPSDLQRVLDNWRLRGEAPLPELAVDDPSYWTRFPVVDLRLIHHITSLTLDMHQRYYAACTPWAPKMLKVINVALSSDFVMSAVLALSACHLAWQTQNADAENLAYRHQGIALRGLHEAISDFSESNSEAILAASLVLSWQATEWRSWASLQQGLSTVMNAMRPWVHTSELAAYVESHRSNIRARTPTTPGTIKRASTSPDDLRRLDMMASALQTLRMRLSNHQELAIHVDRAIGYLQQLQHDSPLQTPEEAFERLQYLRSILFWLAPSVLQPAESDLGAIAMLSHFYALALVLEPLFPDIGEAYLGNIATAPIEHMQGMLLSRQLSMPQDSSIPVALSLIETPVHIMQAYKHTQRSFMPQSVYQQSPHDSYSSPRPRISPLIETSDRPTYVHSPMQSPALVSAPGSSYYYTGTEESKSRRSSGIPHVKQEYMSMAANSLSPSQYQMSDLANWHASASSHDPDYFESATYDQRQRLHAPPSAILQSQRHAPFDGDHTNRFVTLPSVWV